MTLPNTETLGGRVICSYYTEEVQPHDWSQITEFELIIVLNPSEPHYTVIRDDSPGGIVWGESFYNLGQALECYFAAGGMMIDEEGCEVNKLVLQ